MPRKAGADTVNDSTRAKLIRDLETTSRRRDAAETSLTNAVAQQERVIRDATSAGLTPAEIAEHVNVTVTEIRKLTT